MKYAFRHCAYQNRFRNPVGGLGLGDTLCLRLATGTKTEKAVLVLTKDEEIAVRYPMRIIETENSNPSFPIDTGNDVFCDDVFYEVTLDITSVGLYFYHFEVVCSGGDTLIIGRNEYHEAKETSSDEWAIVVYKNKNNSPNKYLSGGIIYQIFPDRFCIGGQRNKTKNYANYREDWGGVPEYKPPITNTDFFGGNLKGITNKLDYLHSLGVSAIYLNPIFEAHSNHKYDTGNYLRIDSDFGSYEDFCELVEKAKKLEIGIILDGVFSHTGDDSIYFNKYGNYDSVGAYQSKDSPYYEWYDFSDFPKKYAAWWGIETLPNINENNKHYTEFICGVEGVVRRWTRAGVCGWRLDVADELPDEFLDNLSRAVKHENSSAVVIGEVWENAATKISYGKRRKYFCGNQLDSVTNYPLKNAIIKFINGGGAHELKSVILEIVSVYPAHAVSNLMNILGSHDTERIRTAFGSYQNVHTRDDKAVAKDETPEKSRKKLMLAAVLQFTLIGVPCIYYGDEAGMEGFSDPFNRRCYPWGNEDTILINFYKTLGKIRNENRDIFAFGDIEILQAENDYFCFTRTNNDKKITVIINLSSDDYFFDSDIKYLDLLGGEKGNLHKIPPQNAAVLTLLA